LKILSNFPLIDCAAPEKINFINQVHILSVFSHFTDSNTLLMMIKGILGKLGYVLMKVDSVG